MLNRCERCGHVCQGKYCESCKVIVAKENYEKKAAEKYPEGKKLWMDILEQIEYLKEIDPKDLYLNKDILRKVKNTFGFTVVDGEAISLKNNKEDKK